MCYCFNFSFGVESKQRFYFDNVLLRCYNMINATGSHLYAFGHFGAAVPTCLWRRFIINVPLSGGDRSRSKEQK